MPSRCDARALQGLLRPLQALIRRSTAPRPRCRRTTRPAAARTAGRQFIQLRCWQRCVQRLLQAHHRPAPSPVRRPWPSLTAMQASPPPRAMRLRGSRAASAARPGHAAAAPPRPGAGRSPAVGCRLLSTPSLHQACSCVGAASSSASQAVAGVGHATAFDHLRYRLAGGRCFQVERAVSAGDRAVVVAELPVLQAAGGQVAGTQQVVLAYLKRSRSVAW